MTQACGPSVVVTAIECRIGAVNLLRSCESLAGHSFSCIACHENKLLCVAL